MSQDWAHELLTARRAAEAACSVIMAQYSSMNAQATAPAEITTQTDRDSQELILKVIAGEFPNDAFRAEETTPTICKLKSFGSRMWIIDPIDGTRGFVTKNGEFSVMIALVSNSIPVVGVVAEPAHGVVTWATTGSGCWQMRDGINRQLAVTSTCELHAMTLIQSHTKSKPGDMAAPNRLSPRHVIESYSAGVKLARVADGTADVYYCDYMTMNDWDLAAGHILVTEAGGAVTNLQGDNRIYGLSSPKQHGGLLASNGQLHQKVLQALKR